MIRPTRHRTRGFTLVELVVVITVVGMLAAIAVPRYIALARDARVASLKTITAAMTSIATHVHAACRLDPVCDYSNATQAVTVGGRQAWVIYGWIGSGGTLGTGQIDSWVDYSGFTATIVFPATLFTVDGAPDPANCSVRYDNAYWSGTGTIGTVVKTSGC